MTSEFLDPNIISISFDAFYAKNPDVLVCEEVDKSVRHDDFKVPNIANSKTFYITKYDPLKTNPPHKVNSIKLYKDMSNSTWLMLYDYPYLKIDHYKTNKKMFIYATTNLDGDFVVDFLNFIRRNFEKTLIPAHEHYIKNGMSLKMLQIPVEESLRIVQLRMDEVFNRMFGHVLKKLESIEDRLDDVERKVGDLGYGGRY